MKKIFIALLLATFTLGASAQFEKGTKYFGASLSGFGISYSKVPGFCIDLQAQATPTKQLASVDAVDFADIHLDFKKFVATKAGVPLELSTREFQILKYFWQRRGEVVLREDLLQDLWGYTPENMPSTRTIDNHIVNLRRKLEDDQANPKIILSIRGAGYKFDA